MVRSDLLAKFASDGVKKQWRIVADDGTVITNNVIVDGSVRLQEPLNTSEQLEFGSCESACFSFQIYERTRLKNKILTVYVTLDDMPEMQVGVYKVDSDKLTANRKMRDIVAYDKLHEILDADVKEWYNTILPNLDAAVSLKQFRESFLRHFDLTFDEENLISDTLTIHKTLDASETAELKGSAILPGICQLNAAFGRIRRDGSFAFVTLPPHQTEISFGLQNGAPYMEDPTYEEYDVQVIDKVVIRESDSGTETATTFSSATAAYKATKAEKDAELEQLNAQLRAYEQGGNAVLTNRKKVSAAKMSAAGWSDFGNASVDDYATVYSSTYSNADGTIAANFTPIETDRNTGDLRIIFTPAQLGEYARAVIDGTSEDWRNLKIGGFFSSISSATQAAATIRTLSEQQMALRDEIDELYVNYLKEGTNVFIIEDNFLIYDATAEQRDAIAEQIYNKVHGIYYRPFELKAPGNLCYEVGDSIKIETKYDVIDTYILERSFSGTGHCEDTYNARGTEKRNEQVTSVSDQVEKLNGRYARLKKNIDGISSEVGKRISEQNTEIRSWVTQQFDGFEAGVTEDNIVDKLNQAMTSVTVRANGIDFNSTGSFTANTKNFKVDATGNVEINSLDAQATITGARIWASEITSSDQYSGNSTIIRDGYIQTNNIQLGTGGEYSRLNNTGLFIGGYLNTYAALQKNLILVKDYGDTVALTGTYVSASDGDNIAQLTSTRMYASHHLSNVHYNLDARGERLMFNASIDSSSDGSPVFPPDFDKAPASVDSTTALYNGGLLIASSGLPTTYQRNFGSFHESFVSNGIGSAMGSWYRARLSNDPQLGLCIEGGSQNPDYFYEIDSIEARSTGVNIVSLEDYTKWANTVQTTGASNTPPYVRHRASISIYPGKSYLQEGPIINIEEEFVKKTYGLSETVVTNDLVHINGYPVLTSKNGWKYMYRLYRENPSSESQANSASVYISSALNFRPQTNNQMTCGSSLAGWKDVYAYNGITQPSDERIKTDIADPNNKYLDFIRNVKPKTYKYKEGQSGRTHLGFIAQDIETLLSKWDIETTEFAGFVKTPIMSEEEPDAIEDFSYSLRYGEFIPLLLMYIKDNERRIKELEERLNGAV